MTTRPARGSAGRGRVVSVLALVLALGCDSAGATSDSTRLRAANAPIVVDSARPMSAMIATFQKGLTRPDSLQSAASSRDILVQRFIRALERSDTAALADMIISRAEFAWLYFPESTVAQPPYELDPALAWFQMRAESEKSLGKLFAELGGHTIAYERHACAATPQREGASRVWRDCKVTWRTLNGLRTERLFMSIIERDGRFKFFSYANRL